MSVSEKLNHTLKPNSIVSLKDNSNRLLSCNSRTHMLGVQAMDIGMV